MQYYIEESFNLTYPKFKILYKVLQNQQQMEHLHLFSVKTCYMSKKNLLNLKGGRDVFSP